MTTQAEEVEQLARDILGGRYAKESAVDVVDSSATAGLDAVLWARLEEAGLTLLTLPEKLGGSGGTLADAAAVLTVAGEFAAAVPLAETDVLGGWLLERAGLAAPPGPLTVAVADDGDGSRSDGRLVLRRVPWARMAAGLVVAFRGTDGERVALVDAPVVGALGANLAEEPRDDVSVAQEVLDARSVLVEVGTLEAARYRGALARSLAMSGAARSALDQTVAHVSTRQQFGRPLSGLQAVQHLLAEMAAEVALMGAAASAAVATVERTGMSSAQSRLAIAAAKGECSRAATVVARIAHQLHGAMGATRESGLRLATSRLWAWREEWGNEHAWAAEVGSSVLMSSSDVWEIVSA
jgi:acyl-CoA dehydrogenase